MNLKIAIIVGSTRPTRVGRKIADWYYQQVKNTDGVDFEIVDLVDHKLPLLEEPKSASSGEYKYDYTKQWSKLINGFDGYVFVTPEYNHGYSAVLKNAIDHLYKEWGRKPVAFVSYGTLGGARAVEQLRQVVVELEMVSTRRLISVLEPWDSVDEFGGVNHAKVVGNIPAHTEELVWWAKTLKAARPN